MPVGAARFGKVRPGPGRSTRDRSRFDVASIVRYLAAEANMFMTGQHFVVDGFQWSC